MVQDHDSKHDDAPDPGVSSVELLRRARGGDARALDALFARHRPALERWARGRLPNWARDAVDTQDMVQETLLKTLSRLEDFEPRGDGALHAYMRQALRFRVVDEVRKARHRPLRAELESGQPHAAASPLEETLGLEALQCYERALERLTASEQEAVVARIELGLDYAELARALGRPSPDAARMAVSRALVRLAEEMGREP